MGVFPSFPGVEVNAPDDGPGGLEVLCPKVAVLTVRKAINSQVTVCGLYGSEGRREGPLYWGVNQKMMKSQTMMKGRVV